MNTDVPTLSRRHLLTVLGGSIAIGSTFVTVSASSNESTLAAQLTTVRSATRRYRDVATARDDGYEPVLGFVPGMGFHFVNGSLIAEDAGTEADITKPPILVYFPTGRYRPEPGEPLPGDDRDVDLRLGAVEYAHGGDAGPPGTPGNYFADEDASRRLKTTEAEGWEWVPPAGITALHVWVHRHNPAGVFNPTNPTIG